jgi:predicted RNA-binding Zn-ribbon protein involved in translation (DUF1610 family)
MNQPIPEELAGFKKLKSILTLKCPNCGKASVFYSPKYKVLTVPVMHETCANCGYRFHKEPGHFDGAVIVSYGLAAIEGLIAYLIAKNFIFGLSSSNQYFFAISVVLLCAMWNYRLARVIWMNIFKG